MQTWSAPLHSASSEGCSAKSSLSIHSCLAADLTQLPLLDAVVRETLRLHGTLPLNTARVTTSDMVIGGYRIPKGTPMMAPSYAIHANADNYVHADKFWPERWLESTDDSTLLDKGVAPSPFASCTKRAAFYRQQ